MPRRQSTSSPAVSTPEKPPPITTKWPSRRRTAGSLVELDARDPAQHRVADVHRVADGLEREAVLGEAGQQVEARAVAEREHEVLVRLLELAGERVARAASCALGSTRRHAAHDEARAADHLPDRRHDLLGEHRRADRLGQHRVERRVALVADEQELVARAAAGRRARAAAWCRRIRRRRSQWSSRVLPTLFGDGSRAARAIAYRPAQGVKRLHARAVRIGGVTSARSGAPRPHERNRQASPAPRAQFGVVPGEPTSGSLMLQGKTALVTGSTSGIGLGIARALRRAGRQRHPERLRRRRARSRSSARARRRPRRRRPLRRRRPVAAGRDRGDDGQGDRGVRRASTSSSTTPASSTSRRSTSSRSPSGTRSSRSTSPPRSTPSASRCRR